MKADDPRMEPDFSKIHLQWFADDEGDGGAGEEESTDGETDVEKNVEEEIAELKKSLGALKKETAGKDRKVSELLEENKKLKEKKSREIEREKRRLDLKDMSEEELNREIEHRENELKAEYERELNEIKEKNKQNEYIQTIYRIAPEIDNLPPCVIKLLTASRDADEDKLRDVMSAAKKDIDILIDKNRIVLGNKMKVTHSPESGEVGAGRVPTEREWAKMDESQRREWAKFATPEQRQKIQYRK